MHTSPEAAGRRIAVRGRALHGAAWLDSSGVRRVGAQSTAPTWSVGPVSRVTSVTRDTARIGCYETERSRMVCSCLLYTSDAADDLLCVDLGGRRIIKKKT